MEVEGVIPKQFLGSLGPEQIGLGVQFQRLKISNYSSSTALETTNAHPAVIQR